MRKLYIVLTFTGTVLSRIIKVFTKNEFAHVSIALDDELNEMYSFGRLNPYNPFWGSFVQEGINIGTFKRFRNTSAEVYSFLVSDEQYEKAKKVIAHYIENRQKYKFNFIGLACVGINKRITRKNRFYCAEFVKHILKSVRITEANKLPKLIKPEDFKQMKGMTLEYKGVLRKYKKPKLLEEMHEILNKKISYV